jgi:aspartate/glutamate racemase
MEDILQAIQRDWGFVASDDCVPVQVALQLMDTSTLGKADREPGFLNMNQQIQKTLKSVVNGRSSHQVLVKTNTEHSDQSITRDLTVPLVHITRSSPIYRARRIESEI